IHRSVEESLTKSFFKTVVKIRQHLWTGFGCAQKLFNTLKHGPKRRHDRVWVRSAMIERVGKGLKLVLTETRHIEDALNILPDIVSNPSSSFRAEGHASNHTLGYKIHVLIDVLESIVDFPVRTLDQSFGKNPCDTFSGALKHSLSAGESLLGAKYKRTSR